MCFFAYKIQNFITFTFCSLLDSGVTYFFYHSNWYKPYSVSFKAMQCKKMRFESRCLLSFNMSEFNYYSRWSISQSPHPAGHLYCAGCIIQVIFPSAKLFLPSHIYRMAEYEKENARPLARKETTSGAQTAAEAKKNSYWKNVAKSKLKSNKGPIQKERWFSKRYLI